MKKVTLLFVGIGLGMWVPLSPIERKNSQNNHAGKKRAPASGRVIFVTGSCSSGKSSLARSIAQHLDAKSYAFDEYVIPIITRKMVEKEVGTVPAFFITRVLSFNGFTLMRLLSEKRKHEYQLKFYAELKKGLAIGPTTKMYQEVRKVALTGRNVVVEAPLHLGDGVDCMQSLSVLKDLDVSFVLAYCPWNNLVERVTARNKSSNKKIHRELDWAVGNFLHYFDISTKQQEGVIDTVLGRSVNDLVTMYSRPEFKKQRMQIAAETKQAAHACFTTPDTYYLRPHLAYDLIVNTQIHKPEEGATRVLNFVQNNAGRKFTQIPWVY